MSLPTGCPRGSQLKSYAWQRSGGEKTLLGSTAILLRQAFAAKGQAVVAQQLACKIARFAQEAGRLETSCHKHLDSISLAYRQVFATDVLYDAIQGICLLFAGMAMPLNGPRLNATPRAPCAFAPPHR